MHNRPSRGRALGLLLAAPPAAAAARRRREGDEKIERDEQGGKLA